MNLFKEQHEQSEYMNLAEKIEKVLHYSDDIINREGVFIPEDISEYVHKISNRYYELLRLNEPNAAVLARVEWLEDILGEEESYWDKNRR